MRLEAIARFKKLFTDGGEAAIVETPLLMLRHLDDMVQCLGSGLATITDRPVAYLNAFKVTVTNNDQARSKIFLRKALVKFLLYEAKIIRTTFTAEKCTTNSNDEFAFILSPISGSRILTMCPGFNNPQ